MMPTESVYGTWPLSGEIDLVEWVNIGEERADGDIDRHAGTSLDQCKVVIIVILVPVFTTKYFPRRSLSRLRD